MITEFVYVVWRGSPSDKGKCRVLGAADRESSQNAETGGWGYECGHCYNFVDIVRLMRSRVTSPAAQEQQE